MSFAALQHFRPRGSTSRGFCLPAMFRPQGLVTLSTVYSPQGPVGSVSRQRRSWASPFGACPPRRYPSVAAREHPHTVLTSVETGAEAPARPAGPRFLGFYPPASPCRPGACLARRHAEAPLGFSLPGHSGDRLVPDFAGTPLTRLAIPWTKSTQPAPQSIGQLSLGPIQPATQAPPCGPHSPLRVPAPLRSQRFKRLTFRAMCSPHAARALLPVVGDLWNRPAPCRS
jgi:hypothetical protein